MVDPAEFVAKARGGVVARAAVKRAHVLGAVVGGATYRQPELQRLDAMQLALWDRAMYQDQ